MKICIVFNATEGREQSWVNAIKGAGFAYDLIDIGQSSWLQEVKDSAPDLVIGVPNSTLSLEKKLFDERIHVIRDFLNKPVYPLYKELLVYENKRMLSYLLRVNAIPHPTTNVFFNAQDATRFIEGMGVPVVMKSNIGASGSGVHIIRDVAKARKIIYKTFKGKGYPRRYGPNLNKKGVVGRILNGIWDPGFVIQKLKLYNEMARDKERCLIVQEYIEHIHEWRTIKIGNIYISHQKVMVKDKASGSGIKNFVCPDIRLLEFVKDVSSQLGIESAAVDIFENESGEYFVNEIQTYYGKPHIMKKDGISGRYVDKKGEWKFEPGDFSKNDTCDLRLDHALMLMNEGRL